MRVKCIHRWRLASCCSSVPERSPSAPKTGAASDVPLSGVRSLEPVLVGVIAITHYLLSDASGAARHSGQPYSDKMASSRHHAFNNVLFHCTRCTTMTVRFGNRAHCPKRPKDVAFVTTLE